MRTMKNELHLEGYLYEHTLEKKVSGPKSANPGTEYITGEIKIATDDELVNVIPVHFTYVTAKTKSGSDNATFATLNNIITGVIGNVMANGVDKAGKLRVDTALALNEFYSDRTGKMELVSVPRNEGGFVHVLPVLEEDPKMEKRNHFDVDILITNVKHIDANEETGVNERAQINGYIFNFRNALLPFSFITTAPRAMNYYESLEATEKNPVLTKIRGRQIVTTVVRETVEESAFGEASVRQTKNKRNEYLVTWGQSITYEFGEEGVLTKEELTAAQAERETYLASVKSRREEYNATKGQAATVAETPSASFNF